METFAVYVKNLRLAFAPKRSKRISGSIYKQVTNIIVQWSGYGSRSLEMGTYAVL